MTQGFYGLSKTLNLPNTDFAMKAGLSQKEPQMLVRWQNDKILSEHP